MVRTAEEARQELVEALDRSFGIEYVPQGELGAGGLRRSSVLILFGALDRVPAEARIPRSVPAELDVLLTRRSPRMRAHAGQIAFPGGGAEPGDADTTETALREAAEETGLDPSGVEVLGALPELHLQVSNNLVTPVIGWWRLPSEVAADHSESVEVMRVPVAEMVDPAARGMSVRRSKEVVYRSAAFELGPQFGGHIVWGFTGMLLSSIYDAAGWAEPWDRTREFEV